MMSQNPSNIICEDSLSHCPICQERLAPNNASLQPCGHEIDFDCTVQYMRSPGPKTCPLCRARVVQVNWNKGENFFVLGSGVGDNGPFIREDETVSAGMSEAEKELRRELRRLRNLEEYNPPRWHIGASWYMKEGDKYVVAATSLSLKIWQEGGIETFSRLIRGLEISTLPLSKSDLLPDLEPAPHFVEIIRTLIAHELALRNLDAKSVRTITLEDDPFFTTRDKRNLFANGARGIRIERPAGTDSPSSKEDIKIEQYVSLQEAFVLPIMGVDADEEKEDATTNEGYNKTEMERLVRLARQEIQSAWDCLGVLKSVWPGMQMRELDKGSTRLGEVFEIAELECTFCGMMNDHRCGECMLPEDMGVLAERIARDHGAN